ncbi:MFS transporter [Streptomyces sp. SudanB182_2057]|uniref:MFS transporter n=1 Tax=Streptomyces sp. SudanB182_2057 TaxID=3035281 RepID=UPI003F56BD9F
MRFPKAFWLLWCGQALNRVGSLAPAFLVLYLEQDHLVDSRTTPLVVGLFGAGVLASSLVGGALADAIGPRRTIIGAQPVAVVTALLYLVTSNMAALCSLALVTGFLSAVDRPASAGLIYEIVPRADFERAYSLYLVGFNVGMSLSPVLSGFLLAYSPPLLFFVWAVGSSLYAALLMGLPKDGGSTGRQGSRGPVLREAARSMAEPFRSPVLAGFLGLTFLMACIYLQVNSTLPLGMRGEGMSPGEVGVVLAVNAVASVVLLPLAPRVARHMREEVPLALSALAIAVGFGLNAFAHSVPGFIVATLVWTLGEVLWAPTSAGFVANRAPEGKVSTYQGSMFFAWNTAAVAGGPIGLVVANTFGYSTLWLSVLVLGLAVTCGFKALVKVPGFRTSPADTAPVSPDHVQVP